uniref:BTB domain-containing protein n=1 Tax=Plectus sambesii TaxID=2011161 RepID=A0A914V5T2_9BILA
MFWLVESPPPTEEVTVNMNVGGFRVETRLATLRKFEHSVIAQMFPPGRWFTEGLFDREQSRFIDRNGEAFIYVLDHLRGKTIMPSDRSLMDRLMDDAEFYGLWELQQKVHNHDLNCREIWIIFEDME